MKVFSGLLMGMMAMSLVGCAAPEPQVASADGVKLAAARKCNRVADAPLGVLAKKDCSGANAGGSQQLDKQEFMNALQTPGSVPQK